MINFWVPGFAAPQGSKEYKGHRNGKPLLVDQCKRLPAWKADVKKASEKAMVGHKMLEKQFVSLSLYFFMPRPKAHYRKDGSLSPNAALRPITTPDLTKMVRAVEDAMSNTVYDDDSRVVVQSNEKYYERENVGPGVHVIVEIAKEFTDNYWLVSHE